MPKLSVHAADFVGTLAPINGDRLVNISRRRCLKAAVSVGLPKTAAASPSSAHAVALASYRALAMKCAIDFSGAELRRPREYRRLDPTEKANISYWTGMAFAEILAEEFLSVPRLLHASVLKDRGRLQIKGGSRSLADLVGQDRRGDWHVVEAKARQGYPSAATKDKWKQQAKTIRSIDSENPLSCSYSLVYVGNRYRAELVDPIPDDERHNGVDLTIEPGALADEYYRPLREWLATGLDAMHRGGPPVVTHISRGGLSIVTRLVGYDPVDAEYVFIGCEAHTLHLSMEGAESFPVLEHGEFSDAYIGSDGIAIITSSKPEVPKNATG